MKASQQADQQRLCAVERELRRKEKALAEAAALLVLRKNRGDLGEDGGPSISAPDRRQAVLRIQAAMQAGVRCAPACRELNLSVRTDPRWIRDGEVRANGRPLAKRPEPANKLTATEREQWLAICHAPEFASLPPSSMVPRLADPGEVLASESSFTFASQRKTVRILILQTAATFRIVRPSRTALMACCRIACKA